MKIALKKREKPMISVDFQQHIENVCEHYQHLRKSEKNESPKMDSPDLIPERFGGAQGGPGNPWEPLKHPKTMKFQVFWGFGNFPLIPL